MRRLIIIASLLLGSPLAALAADVQVTEEVTLVLPSDSSQYFLTGNFNSLTVNNATFSFGISEDASYVEIVSPGKKNLSADTSLDKTLTCRTNDSVLRINFRDTDSSQTVTVTPSGTCGSSSGSGGIMSSGGGGGGGGGSATPYVSTTPAPQTVDKVAQLKQQIAQVQAAISQKIAQRAAPQTTSAVPASVSSVFGSNINPGTRGEDVRRLQALLASDKELYPEGTVSGFYGAFTRQAVLRFQLKHGVVQSGSETGAGRVGPKTRAKLSEVFGETALTPAAPVTPAATPAAATTVPAPQATTAQISAIQEQIKALQARIIQEQIKVIQEKINALKK